MLLQDVEGSKEIDRAVKQCMHLKQQSSTTSGDEHSDGSTGRSGGVGVEGSRRRRRARAGRRWGAGARGGGSSAVTVGGRGRGDGGEGSDDGDGELHFDGVWWVCLGFVWLLSSKGR